MRVSSSVAWPEQLRNQVYKANSSERIHVLRILGDIWHEGVVMIAESEEETKVQHLRAMVSERYDFVITDDYPANMQWIDAWSALRQALVHDEYWLSIPELQFVAALSGTYASMYRWEVSEEHGNEVGKFVPFEDAFAHSVGDNRDENQRIRILFRGERRGHYSRLRLEAEKDALEVGSDAQSSSDGYRSERSSRNA